MRAWLITYRELVIVRLIQISIMLFVLGFHGWANTAVIVCTAFTIFTNTLNQTKLVLANKYFLIFISYFVLTALGVLYSTDIHEGLKYVEQRLLMVLFPFIFISHSISYAKRNAIFFSFIFSVVMGLVIGFFYSYYNYWLTSDSGYFYNDNLVELIVKQATYYSIYINVVLLLIIFILPKLKSKVRTALIFFIPILITAQILLAVRISILTLLIIAISLIIYALITKSSKLALLIVSACIIVCISIVFMFPQTLKRFESMMTNFEYRFDNPNQVNHFNGEISSENWNGLNLRLALWHCGIDIIKERPLIGVGTGDYKSSMRAQYKDKNFLYAIERDFGVHNQFLYTGISFGLIGALIFIGSILLPVLSAGIKQNYLYIGFALIIGIGFLTENILNRYMGIYFFSFFNAFLFTTGKKTN